MNTRLHTRIGAVAATTIAALTLGVGSGQAARTPNPLHGGTGIQLAGFQFAGLQLQGLQFQGLQLSGFALEGLQFSGLRQKYVVRPKGLQPRIPWIPGGRSRT